MTRINDTHIGWWCPLHGYGSGDCCAHGAAPVFAPLATPIESTETREDMERHAEVVVAVHETAVRHCPADDQGPDGVADGDGYMAKRWSFLTYDREGVAEYDMRSPRHGRGRVSGNEADAVLYVVEGKLPDHERDKQRAKEHFASTREVYDAGGGYQLTRLKVKS